MDELRTNYKDQLLDTSVNTERRYNLIDSDGNVVQSGVSLRDVTVYSQEGDSFGAGVLNGITGAINDLNDSLKADGLQFQFATDGEGNYGYLGADGSLVPFKSGYYIPSVDWYMNANDRTEIGRLHLYVHGYKKIRVTEIKSIHDTINIYNKKITFLDENKSELQHTTWSGDSIDVDIPQKSSYCHISFYFESAGTTNDYGLSFNDIYVL